MAAKDVTVRIAIDSVDITLRCEDCVADLACWRGIRLSELESEEIAKRFVLYRDIHHSVAGCKDHHVQGLVDVNAHLADPAHNDGASRVDSQQQQRATDDQE